MNAGPERRLGRGNRQSFEAASRHVARNLRSGQPVEVVDVRQVL